MNLERLIVAIDAGHGGADGGATGTLHPEKYYNRLVAMRVRELLLAAGAWPFTLRWSGEGGGIDDRQFLRLSERVAKINSFRAPDGRKVQVVLCIHHNAGPPTAKGLEVWYNTDQEDSRKLGVAVYAGMLDKMGLKGRGVKHNRLFTMTKRPLAPSVISEGAFITNPKEEKWLAENWHLEAEGVVAGLKAAAL